MGSANNTIIDHAYYYRFSTTAGELLHKFKVFEGKVVNYRCNYYRFMCEDGGYRPCSCEEGKIHYGNLWLKERDDEKAIEMFVKGQQERIDALKQQIEDIEYSIRAVQNQ